MDNLEQDAITAAAEAMAESITEDPEKRMLITEGFRALWRSKAAGVNVPLEIDITRFFLERYIDGGKIIFWDFATVSAYMEKVEFSENGCDVHNGRTGRVHSLGYDAACAYLRFIMARLPGGWPAAVDLVQKTLDGNASA